MTTPGWSLDQSSDVCESQSVKPQTEGSSHGESREVGDLLTFVTAVVKSRKVTCDSHVAPES
jgi:hypothetical protein